MTNVIVEMTFTKITTFITKMKEANHTILMNRIFNM